MTTANDELLRKAERDAVASECANLREEFTDLNKRAGITRDAFRKFLERSTRKSAFGDSVKLVPDITDPRAIVCTFYFGDLKTYEFKVSYETLCQAFEILQRMAPEAGLQRDSTEKG